MNSSMFFMLLVGCFAFGNAYLFATHELGYEYQGNDMQTPIVNVPNLNACQLKCKETQGCRGYSYHTIQKVCFLKSSVLMEDRIAKRAMISGRVTICSNEEDVDYPQNDILRHKVDSLISCQETCLNTEYCKLYAFNAVTGDCWTKHTVGTKTPKPKTSGQAYFSGLCALPVDQRLRGRLSDIIDEVDELGPNTNGRRSWGF